MDVIEFENLYESMLKCKNGVIWKESVARYFLNGIENTLKLEKELKGGTYKARPPFHFSITTPKPRELVSICFRDRVYQRSLNDNVLCPTMTNCFIYDNHACQKKKGTDKARERLKCFLNRYYRIFGDEGYILQIDIHGYYQNMSHEITEDLFRQKLDEENFQRTKSVLDWQYTGEKGYNPGSQMIQIAGISYLDRFDHFCKEKLKLKYYLRYMDDVIIVHNDKEYLNRIKFVLGEKLAEFELTYNPKKTRIYKVKDGVLFLGFVFRLTKTGKVVMTLNPKNVKATRRKLKKLVSMAKQGKRSKEDIDVSFQCWKANALKGNNHNLIRKMENYYETLWKEKNEDS